MLNEFAVWIEIDVCHLCNLLSCLVLQFGLHVFSDCWWHLFHELFFHDVIECDCAGSLLHHRPKLGWAPTFSWSARDDGVGHLLEGAPMFFLEVGDEGIPVLLRRRSRHEVVEHRVFVAGYFLVEMSEFEFRVCYVETIKGGIHSTEPLVDVFWIEWGNVGFAHVLLLDGCTLHGGVDGSLDDGGVVGGLPCRSCCDCSFNHGAHLVRIHDLCEGESRWGGWSVRGRGSLSSAAAAIETEMFAWRASTWGSRCSTFLLCLKSDCFKVF